MNEEYIRNLVAEALSILSLVMLQTKDGLAVAIILVSEERNNIVWSEIDQPFDPVPLAEAYPTLIGIVDHVQNRSV